MDQDRVDRLLAAFKALQPAQIRLKLRDDPEVWEWSDWVIQPEVGYIEPENVGPVLIKDVEWLEIRVMNESDSIPPG